MPTVFEGVKSCPNNHQHGATKLPRRIDEDVIDERNFKDGKGKIYSTTLKEPLFQKIPLEDLGHVKHHRKNGLLPIISIPSTTTEWNIIGRQNCFPEASNRPACLEKSTLIKINTGGRNICLC